MILLPGDPLFDEVITEHFSTWFERLRRIGSNVSFVVEPGSGILRPATPEELREYMYGGEYEERLEELDKLDDMDSNGESAT